MGRGISLQRYAESKASIDNGARQVFRLQILALDAVLMPVKIFAHRRLPVDPREQFVAEEFCFVCSPEDFALYPEDEPNPIQVPAFYRKDTIDIQVPSRDLALETWRLVKSDVCELVAAFGRKDELVLEETFRCGDDLVTDSLSVSQSLSL